MTITLEHIYSELQEIKKMLHQQEKIEERIEEEERHIEAMEDEELKKIKGPFRFRDVVSWKGNVWDSCEFKNESVDKTRIWFSCKKTGSVCEFTKCPKNIV